MKSLKLMQGTPFKTIILTLGIILLASLFLGLTYFYPVSLPDAKVDLPDNFEMAISRAETSIGPLPETEKKFFWASEQKNKTPVAFVNLHGYSATRQEISPVAEEIARNFQSNLFMTRLRGHGMGSAGMLQATTVNLLEDAEQAFQVGKRIGDKVVLIGTSTGAALALYLASKHPEEIAALVLISPIFRTKRWDSLFLKGPFGPWLSQWMVGEYYEFLPANEGQKKFWTYRYPSHALHELVTLVDGIQRLDLAQIKIPTVVFYSDRDEVVSVDLIKEKYELLGSKQKDLIHIPATNHLLAGAIMSPSTTQEVIQRAEDFLKKNLQ